MNSSALATANIHQDHNIVTLPQHQHHTSSAIATAASTNILHHQTPATTGSISYLHQQPPIHTTIQQQQQPPQHHAIYDSTTIHNGQDHLLIQGNTDIVVYRNIDALQCPPGVHLVPHRFIPMHAQPQPQQRQRHTGATGFEQHLQQQPHFTQQHISALLPQHSAQLTQHYAQQHFATQVSQTPPQMQPQPHQLPMQLHQLPTTATAQYYVPTDAAVTVTTATTTANVLPPTLTALSATPTLISATVTPATTIPSTQQLTTPTPANSTTSSTVVLDRINICINNHYNDATSSSINGVGAVGSPSALANSSAQQTSPIIPAIQHKAAIVDSVISGLFIDPFGGSNDSTLIIDEPDSTTTTPHTPPTTPEGNSPTKILQSPLTSNSIVASEATAASEHDISITDKICVMELEEVVQLQLQLSPPQQQQQELTAAATPLSHTQSAPTPPPPTALITTTPLTPTTPPTPPPPPPPAVPAIIYSIGEDIFIKRLDCFYLGTIIDNVRQQFLIRFDDESQLWCSTDIMCKLGGSGVNCDNDQSSDHGQMCVACKRSKQNDAVEICERCGRGYHRNCTTETSPGSGVWLCKRCAKPMKMLIKSAVCRQLPYHVDTLKWDEKHRVNEEQIYCYCGKTGKFDHNMLQCCKCKNWFHTDCMQCFTSKILRGDGFFVFCCSVCNDGKEFSRRLQMNWVDVMHLTLYNLSAMKKHQHHKYHHLLQDIWPFILEKRSALPIPKKWIEMSEIEFKEKITETLKENTDRFICGREAKRGHYYYALRNNGPPILPKFNVNADDLLCDELLAESLKLTLWKHEERENDFNETTADNSFNFREVALKLKAKENLMSKSKSDVYEFRIEDDEKFTSDDEIPIKHIIEKAKKIKTTPSTKDKCNNSSSIKSCNNNIIRKHAPTAINDAKVGLDVENANDAQLSLLTIKKNSASSTQSHQHEQIAKQQLTPKKTISTGDNNNQQQLVELNKSEIQANPTSAAAPSTATVATVNEQKSSRKRKAFTLSKSYKEIAAEAAAKRYDCSRICDSSSDENSSSSRGTSLDVIIPAPKNFLGSNNPFRMVTPKKNANVEQPSIKKTVSFGRNCGGGTVIKNSIFNTSALDFSSKLAALKSAGIFPNLSTSDLAKAAGQPRTVRTIKRRLSAKDITIGPNQEVRRRRTRRLSSNIEVISTTTINPIPSNFFPLHAKDLLTSTRTIINHHHKLNFHQSTINHQTPSVTATTTTPQLTSSASSAPLASTSSIDATTPTTTTELHTAKLAAVAATAATITTKPTHGRRLRVRPLKTSPSNSRRSSISGASTSSNTSSNGVVVAGTPTTAATTTTSETILQDLKQSVNKYFGAVNRIESGEQFSIRAKRQLANGQWQYLIEWGDVTMTSTVAAANNIALNSPNINATSGTVA